MAKEIVVTSVPRGIKLGRTGFQVVMRTAGLSDSVMTSLEQCAGYRHVNPQGSGRNPVIYSYRSVRGNTGQLNVLGRTVDAGNDFSNRSNKLAHLLAFEPDELLALRNSSPPAVLAAIEGRLANVWQGGPEERASSFPLPAPLVQAAVCHRWGGVTGDAGWGGVLAQRALRGQPSLVIAPECSPAWCRTLLELFQEVFALLPADARWRTTFDTTVIGGSTSLLRGTYAGSPEAATGYAGLLVVDLSSRARVPANMAADDLVSVAREGPKQLVSPGPARIPSLPPTLGGGAEPMFPVGQTAVDPHHPPRAPVGWDDDDAEPKSRLHWYILSGVLLAAIVLVTGSVAARYTLDVMATQGCRNKISEYADADGGKRPEKESVPTLDDWKRAFRDDKQFPSEAEFQLLLSALRTGNVTKDSVVNQRTGLLAAVRDVLQGKNGVANAKTLGAVVASTVDEKTQPAIDSLVEGWIASKATPQIDSVNKLQKAIEAATQVVLVASDTKDGEKRQPLTAESVDFLWPNRLPGERRLQVLEYLGDSLAVKKAGLSYEAASNLLAEAIKNDAKAASDEGGPKAGAADPASGDMPQPTREELAVNAFNTLGSRLASYQPKFLNVSLAEPVSLASGLDAENLTFVLSLPACGKWEPKVEPPPNQAEGPHTWKLKGLPDAPDEHWGTVTLDKEKGELTFKSELGPDGPQDHLYIPLKFAPEKGQSIEPIVLFSIALPQQVVAEPTKAAGCSLYDVLTGDPVTLTTNPALKVAPSLLNAPNLLTVKMNRRGSENAPEVSLETREANGAQNRITDLWVNIATGVPEKIRQVWLESLASEILATDGGVSIQLSRKNSPPWTERVTRFGDRDPEMPFPKLSVEWSRDRFVQLFKVILDDHDRDPKNTIDVLEKRMEMCLGLRPNEDKMRLDAWRWRTFEFVADPKSPFRGFVEMKFVEERGERPQPPEPPKELDSKASTEAQDKYKNDRDAYREELKAVGEACRVWDDDLNTRVRSSDWLTKFLFNSEPTNRNRDAQEFGLALLGIDAWLAIDGKKDALMTEFKEILLNDIVTATLELQWAWPTDGEPIRVKRFEIKRVEFKFPAGLSL